jgi:hypothetical protein
METTGPSTVDFSDEARAKAQRRAAQGVRLDYLVATRPSHS